MLYHVTFISNAVVKFIMPLEEEERDNVQRLTEKCNQQKKELLSLESTIKKPPADGKGKAQLTMTVRYDVADLKLKDEMEVKTLPPKAAVRLLLSYDKLPKSTKRTIFGTNVESPAENEVDFVIHDQEEMQYVVDTVEQIKERSGGENNRGED